MTKHQTHAQTPATTSEACTDTRKGQPQSVAEGDTLDVETLTPDNIETFVVGWAASQAERFQYTWTVKGGWEGWVQVDLVAYIFSRGTNADVLREQSIFTNSSKRVDLLFNGSDTQPKNQVPMEIKAESLENSSNFLPGLEDDVTKLEEERRAEYAESFCYAMGIAVSPEAASAMLKIERDGVRIFREVFPSTDVSIALALWSPDQGDEGGWVPAN